MMQENNLEKRKSVSMIFPHQLFEKNPCIYEQRIIYIVEEYLFFRQFNFHKQKIAFHRSSMKFYENYLRKKNYKVIYIESFEELSDVRNLVKYFAELGIKEVHFCDVVDDWLEKRIKERCKELNIRFREYDSRQFINSKKRFGYIFPRK